MSLFHFLKFSKDLTNFPSTLYDTLKRLRKTVRCFHSHSVSSFWLSRNTNKKHFQIIYLTSYFVMTSRYFTINPRITRYSNFKRKQKSWSVAEAHYTNVVETHRAPGFGAMVSEGVEIRKVSRGLRFFFFFFISCSLKRDARKIGKWTSRTIAKDRLVLVEGKAKCDFLLFFLISLLFRLLAICWLAKKNVTAFVELQTLSADVCPHTNFYKIYRTPNNV